MLKRSVKEIIPATIGVGSIELHEFGMIIKYEWPSSCEVIVHFNCF